MGVRCLPKHAKEIVLDLDAMGHVVHGLQEGRHFSAYYGDYCYLPLYMVVGDVVLWAQLRTSDRDGADGVVPALEKIVAAIRRRCKKARIVGQGRLAQHAQAETLPFPMILDGDHHIAVAAGKGRIGIYGGMGEAVAAHFMALF